MNYSNPYIEKGDMFFTEGFSLYVNRVNEQFELPVHKHDFIEICYVWEGGGFHYIGDDLIRVQKGDIFFIPIGVSHIFRPSAPNTKNKLIIGNCLVDVKMFEYVTSVLPAALGLYKFQILPQVTSDYLHGHEKNKEFEQLFQQLHQEFLEMRNGYQTMLCGLLLQLLIAFERVLLVKTESTSEQSIKMQLIQDYIHAKLSQKISLPEMANSTNMTIRQLQRVVRKYKDMTVLEYIQHERMSKACELLSSLECEYLTIFDIASRVGIHDMKRFHTLFKSRTCMTPGQYRQQHLSAILI